MQDFDFSGGALVIFSSILFSFRAICMAKLSIVSFIIFLYCFELEKLNFIQILLSSSVFDKFPTVVLENGQLK